MIQRVDRWWLAWKIIRGRCVSYSADSRSFRVTLDFTADERMELNNRINRPAKRRRRR